MIASSIVMMLIFGVNISLAAAVDSQVSSGLELRLVDGGDLGAQDNELDFEFKKQRYGVKRIGAWFKGLVIDEYKNTQIKSSIVGEKGELEVIYNKKGKFKVKLSDTSKLRPGKYELEITIQDENLSNNEEIIFTQEFTWGVLAYNSNKSIYKPGERAFLQFAVLDDNGDTLCDADLRVVIDEPGWGKKVLSTKDGSIVLNEKCGPNNVIDEPDYYANYEVNDIGEYQLTITAFTGNGEREITDSFRVDNYIPFEIERIGPTRIYPMADYIMKILVKANEDFSGSIIEVVPSSFLIKNEELRIKNEIINDSIFIIQDGKNEKELIFKNLNIKKGDVVCHCERPK